MDSRQEKRPAEAGGSDLCSRYLLAVQLAVCWHREAMDHQGADMLCAICEGDTESIRQALEVVDLSDPPFRGQLCKGL